MSQADEADPVASQGAAPADARWCTLGGLMVLTSLALTAHTKHQADVLIELMWACHVAALILGVGLLLRRHAMIGVGFLFFAAAGLPGYLLNLIFSGEGTSWTSALEHGLCPLVGGLYVWRHGLTRRAWLWGWWLAVTLQGVSGHLTPPQLNINLAHSTWSPLTAYFSQVWMYKVANAAFGMAALYGLERALRALMARLGAPGVSRQGARG